MTNQPRRGRTLGETAWRTKDAQLAALSPNFYEGLKAFEDSAIIKELERMQKLFEDFRAAGGMEQLEKLQKVVAQTAESLPPETKKK